jgi:hypothetical protein
MLAVFFYFISTVVVKLKYSRVESSSDPDKGSAFFVLECPRSRTIRSTNLQPFTLCIAGAQIGPCNQVAHQSSIPGVGKASDDAKGPKEYAVHHSL